MGPEVPREPRATTTATDHRCGLGPGQMHTPWSPGSPRPVKGLTLVSSRPSPGTPGSLPDLRPRHPGPVAVSPVRAAATHGRTAISNSWIPSATRAPVSVRPAPAGDGRPAGGGGRRTSGASAPPSAGQRHHHVAFEPMAFHRAAGGAGATAARQSAALSQRSRCACRLGAEVVSRLRLRRLGLQPQGRCQRAQLDRRVHKRSDLSGRSGDCRRFR